MIINWFGYGLQVIIHSMTKLMQPKFEIMTLKPINTEKDYQAALSRLEQIFDSKKGSPEGDELEILAILIEKYENEHFPISLPDPIEAIKFRMEQLGYNQTDLVELSDFKVALVKY